MEQDQALLDRARGRGFAQQPQEPGVFSGLLDLLPRLGYNNLLPSVSIVQQERAPRSNTTQSRQHSRALSEDSTPDSTDSTQDSTEALLQAEQSEATTSGRNASDSAGQADAPAVAAARHRVGSANNFDLQVIAQWVEKTAPFLVLLLIVFVQAHFKGIAVFAWLQFTLYKANQTLRHQVALKTEYNRRTCMSLAAALVLHIPAVLLCLRSDHLWDRFLLMTPSQAPTFWTALFWVTTVDLLASYQGIVVKLGVTIGWSSSTAEGFRRRAQILTWVETLTLLYRALLPVPVWYKYFEDSGMGMVLCALTTGVYLLVKCGMLVERATLLLTTAKAIIRQEAAYGQYARPEDVMEAGNQCAICQDPMTDPIKLRCNHIFCDLCISEWFERERTCPMCRAVIKPAGLHASGDGSTSQLPQCF